MSAAKVLGVAVVWSASLIGVGLVAQGGSGSKPVEKPAPVIEMGKPFGPVITGDNIGFQRIGGHLDRDGRVIGNLMVRVNGEWYEVTSPMRIVR